MTPKHTLSNTLELGIAWLMPFLIRVSLRRGLRGVWARGDWDALPAGGVIVAVNHHSWWDLYLMVLIGQVLGRDVRGVMRHEQLETYRFFRHLGAISHKQVRQSLRALQAGQLVFIFPEGELRPAGSVTQVQPGVVFLARKSGVPVVPLALRVVMRGAQHPEAFLWLGDALATDVNADTLQARMNAQLAELDTLLASTPVEVTPDGFTRWSGGQASTSDRMRWVKRLWS